MRELKREEFGATNLGVLTVITKGFDEDDAYDRKGTEVTVRQGGRTLATFTDEDGSGARGKANALVKAMSGGAVIEGVKPGIDESLLTAAAEPANFFDEDKKVKGREEAGRIGQDLGEVVVHSEESNTPERDKEGNVTPKVDEKRQPSAKAPQKPDDAVRR